MFWIEKIIQWRNGIVPTFPNLDGRFLFETSRLGNMYTDMYDEELIPYSLLDEMTCNFSAFKTHMSLSSDKNVVCFPNKTNTAIMCVPMPRKGKDYTTIKEFTNNASKRQQKAFWKKVADVVEDYQNDHPSTYISTHGLGVPYFHLRIESKPKYYVSTNFN